MWEIIHLIFYQIWCLASEHRTSMNYLIFFLWLFEVKSAFCFTTEKCYLQMIIYCLFTSNLIAFVITILSTQPMVCQWLVKKWLQSLRSRYSSPETDQTSPVCGAAILLPFKTRDVLIRGILLSAVVCPLRVQLKAWNGEVNRHLVNKTPRST